MAKKPFIPLLANRHQVVAAGSIGVALVVMGIKYVAYLMTGSVAPSAVIADGFCSEGVG